MARSWARCQCPHARTRPTSHVECGSLPSTRALHWASSLAALGRQPASASPSARPASRRRRPCRGAERRRVQSLARVRRAVARDGAPGGRSLGGLGSSLGGRRRAAARRRPPPRARLGLSLRAGLRAGLRARPRVSESAGGELRAGLKHVLLLLLGLMQCRVLGRERCARRRARRVRRRRRRRVCVRAQRGAELCHLWWAGGAGLMRTWCLLGGNRHPCEHGAPPPHLGPEHVSITSRHLAAVELARC